MDKKGDTEAPLARAYTAFLAAWIGAVARHAWAVLALAVVATAAVAWYTVENFAIDTDTAALISEDLDYRRVYREYQRAFPQGKGNLLVVIDGANADLADDAAAALTARLRRNPALFRTVFYPQGEPFFRRNGLMYLDLDELADLADRLARAQPLLASLSADMSLRGLMDVLTLAIAEGTEDLRGLDPVLGEIGMALRARLDGRTHRTSWVELMRGQPADTSDDESGRRRLIVVQPNLDYASLSPGARAMAAVRAQARDLGFGPDSGVRVRLTGSVALDTEELQSVADGAGTAGMISLVLVLGLLFAGLRAPRLVLATLVTLFCGLIWTAAFGIFAIGHLNMISVAFAVLFIGLGVDFGIHFVLRYQEERARGGDNAAALAGTAHGVGLALTLCAVSAAFAFLSFLPTDYRGVAELGLISGAGMFVALIANFTLLPALLTLMPGKPGAPRDARLALALARGLDGLIHRHSRAIALVALAFGLAAAVAAAQIRFDFDPLNLKDPSTESVQTVFDLMGQSRTIPGTLSVVAPNLAAAVAIAGRLERLAEVDRAVTLADFVPGDQAEKLAIIDDMALFLTPLLVAGPTAPAPGVAGNRAALAAFGKALQAAIAAGRERAFGVDIAGLVRDLDRYEARLAANPSDIEALESGLIGFLPARIEALKRSLDAGPVTAADLPPGVRDRQIAADGRARVEVFPLAGVLDNEARRRFVEAVRAVAPTATSGSVMLLESGDTVMGAFRQASLTAMALILLLLGVLLRNLWDIGLVLAPLLLAMVLTIGGAVLMGMSLNFANIIALPLLLGLGVASSIHLVMRGRGTGGRARELMATSTPRAVLFSALTTIGSFGSLAISSHRGTASMGQLLTLALAMTLVCSLIVLPALMELRHARRERAA